MKLKEARRRAWAELLDAQQARRQRQEAEATEPELRPPVDPEEMAALLDGRLSGEARTRMLERLAEDEDAYELFVASAETLDELERQADRDPAEDPLPNVLTHPGPRHDWHTWVALAAALVAVAFLGLWVLPRLVPAAHSSGQLLAALSPNVEPTDLSGYVRDRVGPAFRALDTPRVRQAPFILGVRALDLAVAAAAGDDAAAAGHSREIAHLLRTSIDLSESWQATYADLAEEAETGGSPEVLASTAAAAEAGLEQLFAADPSESLHFALGRWVEAARLAAAAGDAGFFAEARAAKRPLRRFRGAAPSAQVDDRLARVEAALAEPEPDLATIEEQLTAILDHCADGRACLDHQPPAT